MGTWDDAHSSDQPFHTFPQTKAKSLCPQKSIHECLQWIFIARKYKQSKWPPPNQQTDPCTAMG